MEDKLIGYSVSEVIVANFPLNEYSLQWFMASGVLKQDEIALAFGGSYNNESCVHIQWSDIQIDITKDKFQIIGTPNNIERVSEILTSVLNQKVLNGLQAIGLNGEAVFRLTRQEYENQKNNLFPTNALTNLFHNDTFITEIQCHYSLTNLQLHCVEKLLELNPNNAVISFSYNKHFQLNNGNVEELIACVKQINECWSDMYTKFSSLINNA